MRPTTISSLAARSVAFCRALESYTATPTSYSPAGTVGRSHEGALEQPAADLPVGRAVAAAGQRLLLLVPVLAVRAAQHRQ